jgi:hypothetical protein
MCGKCDEINNKIAKLKNRVDPGIDVLNLTLIRQAVRNLETEKASFGCDGIADR